MGVLRQGQRCYFYESKCLNGRKTNTLVACGVAAEMLWSRSRDEAEERRVSAEEEARRRRARREAAATRADRIRAGRLEEASVIELAAAIRSMADGVLSSMGYRLRRGEWRRPRGRPMADDPSTLAGRETDAQARHFARAAAGDERERPAVRRLFDAAEEEDSTRVDGAARPRSFADAVVLAYGGNALQKAEDALLRRYSAGRGLYAEEAGRRHLAKYRRDLLGDDPTPVERALVDAIALVYLDLMTAEEEAASATSRDPAYLTYLDRRKDRASKRYVRCLRALDTLRRKVPPTVAVQINVSPNPTPSEP